VRDRYVSQVLLVALGFGVLLALIAVVDAPKDWSQPVAGAARVSEAAQPAISKPAGTKMAEPRGADFKDECEFPARLLHDCPQPEPQEICEKSGASVRKAGAAAE